MRLSIAVAVVAVHAAICASMSVTDGEDAARACARDCVRRSRSLAEWGGGAAT